MTVAAAADFLGLNGNLLSSSSLKTMQILESTIPSMHIPNRLADLTLGY